MAGEPSDTANPPLSPPTPSMPAAARRAAQAVAGIAEEAWQRFDLRRWSIYLQQAARQGWRRVRGSATPILQASAAALIAFLIGQHLLQHRVPFLAPIGAWICLGFTKNRVPRKVVEMGLGATLGVLIGEVILTVLGGGAWQLGVALVAAALVARFLDRGDLFTMQSGVNAMVVVGMGDLLASTGGPFARLADAIIGALIAFIFSVVLPRDLTSRPRRYARSVVVELATVLGTIADGLRLGNPERLRDAHAQMRGLSEIIEDGQAVVKSSCDIVRLNPSLRRDRPQLDELTRQFGLLERAAGTVEMLLRQSRGIVDETGAAPRAAVLVDQAQQVLLVLSAAVGEFHRPIRARELATQLAADCAPGQSGSDWRAATLVSLMRSVTIDLLQLTGLSRHQARLVLPDTGDGPGARGTPDGLETDVPSRVWQVETPASPGPDEDARS